jgi:peptide/nickel transport system substrate-binding protein
MTHTPFWSGSLYTCLALSAVILTSACQPSAPLGGAARSTTGEQPAAGEGQPKYGGIAVIANRADAPGSWDSMLTSTITLTHVSLGVYGEANLVRRCREDIYKLCPSLAESWEPSSDFTQWTFKIRDGVLWHDGTPFTAADVKFWADLAYNGAKVGDKTRPPALFKAELGDLKSVEVMDGNRVRFNLGGPIPYYPDLLSRPPVTIAHPRHLMEPRIQQGEVMIGPADVGWVGLGPFKMVKHDKGSVIELRRFDQYWEKDSAGRQLPYLDGIDFPIISDPSSMVAAFRSGRLDGGARGVGFGILPDQRASIEQSLKDQVQFVNIAAYRWAFHFNTVMASPFQDVRVRKAISLWLDRRAGIQAALGGSGTMSSIMSPTSPWPSPDWATWPGFNESTREQDRAEAKRLLASAGYGSGLEMMLMCRPVWAQACEWLQGDLAGLGVQVKFNLLDDATWNQQQRSTSDWHMQQAAFTDLIPEALERQLARASVSPNAAPKHEDDRVPEMFARFRQVKTPDERLQVAREIEKYVLQDQVYSIVTFNELQVLPYRSYVKGLFAPPEELGHNVDFATVWLDK